jgi:hypothetical protein
MFNSKVKSAGKNGLFSGNDRSQAGGSEVQQNSADRLPFQNCASEANRRHSAKCDPAFDTDRFASTKPKRP